MRCIDHGIVLERVLRCTRRTSGTDKDTER